MCTLHFKASLLSANTNDVHIIIEQFPEVAAINNEGISPHLCVLFKMLFSHTDENCGPKRKQSN